MREGKAVCVSRACAEDLPIELIFHILHGNVGLYTLACARQVNRAWAAACDDEKLIVSVAHYTDGLTRTQLRGLLRLTKEQATTFPSMACGSAAGTPYSLYSPATVQKALLWLDGMRGLRSRKPMLPWSNPPLDPSARLQRRLKLADREECLHRRAENVRRIKARLTQEFASR